MLGPWTDVTSEAMASPDSEVDGVVIHKMSLPDAILDAADNFVEISDVCVESLTVTDRSVCGRVVYRERMRQTMMARRVMERGRKEETEEKTSMSL